MKKVIAVILISAAIGLFAYSLFSKKDTISNFEISIPADLSKPLLELASQYEKEFGVVINSESTATDVELSIAPDSTNQELRLKGKIREIIPIARINEVSFSAGVPSKNPDPAAAIRFARYLAAPEKGGLVFKNLGITPIPGDTWAEKPDLVLYSGGVNRPAVENLLTEFSRREGVSMTTVFNGCGILCASMQAMPDTESARFPDAYFACDICFVPPVAEHFTDVVLLTETDIGIAFPKGNPHNIKTLTDLAKPGLKVGLCNQEQSTLGYMTGGILRDTGLETSIRKNAAVEVPTADFLITQMRSGALDAAIVYRVNAELQKEHIEFIKIKHEGAVAVQPFSVRKDSPKRQLATRLQEHFLANPKAFTDSGFLWRGDKTPVKSADIEVPKWLRRE